MGKPPMTLAVIAVVTTIVASGCSSSEPTDDTNSASASGPCGSGREVTIEWQNWISQEDASRQFASDAIKAFEAKCPNITIESVGVPAEKTPQALSLAASSKSGPDVFQTSLLYTAEYTAIGLFQDMSSLMGDTKSTMLDKAVDLGSADNKWTNVAWGLAPFFLTYNKNVMETAGLDPSEPPTTMQELVDMSKEIGTAGGGNYYGYCQDSGNNELNGIWSQIYLLTEGGALATSDNKPTVNSAKNVQILTDYQQWYNTPGAWAQGIDVRACRDLFASNKVAFNFESSWATGIYRSGSGEGEAFDSQWGAVPIPAGPSGRGVSVDASQGLAVASYSAHPAEGAAFIKFMISDRGITTEYLNTVGFPSPVQSLWAASEYQTPIIQALLEAAPDAYLFKTERYTELITALGTSLQEITANEADVQSTLDKLQETFEASS